MQNNKKKLYRKIKRVQWLKHVFTVCIAGVSIASILALMFHYEMKHNPYWILIVVSIMFLCCEWVLPFIERQYRKKIRNRK